MTDSPATLSGIRVIRRRYIRPYANPVHSSLVRKLTKLLMFALWALDLLVLCIRDRPDCIFSGQAIDTGPLAILANWLFGIPYIVFVYGEELTKSQKLPLRARVIRKVCQHAGKVITISDFTVEELIKEGVRRDRLALVTPGTDHRQFTPDIDVTNFRRKLAPDDHQILLTVGRLTRRKGHANVIAVLPNVLEVVPKLRYLIAGVDVGEGANLRMLAANLGVERHVQFVGHVAEEDLPKFFCACDVFVMANYEIEATRDTEGFGIVFLEANACGKPVIGGRTGGVQTAILDGVTGLLVNAADKDELAGAIIKLLTNREYANRLGQSGRERVVTQGSWNSKAIAVYEVATNLISEMQNSGKVGSLDTTK